MIIANTVLNISGTNLIKVVCSATITCDFPCRMVFFNIVYIIAEIVTEISRYEILFEIYIFNRDISQSV